MKCNLEGAVDKIGVSRGLIALSLKRNFLKIFKLVTFE